MKPLLITAAGRTLSSAPLGRREDDVEVRRVPVLPTAGSLDAMRPTVIVLDSALVASAGGETDRFRELAAVASLVAIGDVGDPEPSDALPLEFLTGFLPGDASPGAVFALLRGGFRHAASLVAERRAVAEEDERHRELTELTSVGVALSTQRDLLLRVAANDGIVEVEV